MVNLRIGKRYYVKDEDKLMGWIILWKDIESVGLYDINKLWW